MTRSGAGRVTEPPNQYVLMLLKCRRTPRLARNCNARPQRVQGAQYQAHNHTHKGQHSIPTVETIHALVQRKVEATQLERDVTVAFDGEVPRPQFRKTTEKISANLGTTHGNLRARAPVIDG